MVRRNFHQYLILLTITIAFSNCVTSKLKVDNRSLKRFFENSEAFRNSFSGFSLYDPAKDDYIFQFNGQKFFTPASNTKLYTFYTGKKIFADSIPGIKYTFRNDTLYFTGTGDPTFLDEDFPEQPVFEFLKNTSKTLVYCETDLLNERYGPGWAWDDYMYYYSPEKSSMPIYANVIRLNRTPDEPVLSVTPSGFKRSVIHIRDSVFRTTRAENENEFIVYHDQYPDTIDRKIPYRYSAEIMLRLLSDTLKKPVFHSLFKHPEMSNIVYSQHIDSVMKKLLLVSDNFIAEQLLIMGAGYLSDSLDADVCIDFALKNLFPELKDQIHWVDGSGLSRYNKFTPQAMVALLRKIYSKYPMETIIELFPTGGVSGTLKNNFKNEIPYIIAKTGSLSNVYNLSGFLITKKGQWFIFSFMNNNFEVPTAMVKSEMEKILKNIYLKF